MKNAALLLGTLPIPRLLLRFAAPAMISVLANSLYNIVDRIFLGKYTGADGLAAVAIFFPLQLTVIALGSLAGVGTASQISRALGAENTPRAEKAFGNGVFFSLAALLLAVPWMCFFIPQTAALCGASGSIGPVAERYFEIVVPAIPCHFFSIFFMTTLRAEGRPKIAMCGVVAGATVNIVLDWLFIVRFQLGASGAAWGTSVAQFCVFCFFLSFYLLKKTLLPLSLRLMKPDLSILKELIAVGLSPFIGDFSFAVMQACFNILLGRYGGPLAVAASGVFFGVDSLLFMPVTGLGEGVMPVVGYNYGAKRFSRLREAIRLSLLCGILCYIASESAALLCPEMLAFPFVSGDAELLRHSVRAIRIGYSLLPFSAIAVLSGYILNALGKARTAFFFNISRQIFCLILLAILPPLFQEDGVWMSLPAIDLAGGVLAGYLLWRHTCQWPQNSQ